MLTANEQQNPFAPETPTSSAEPEIKYDRRTGQMSPVGERDWGNSWSTETGAAVEQSQEKSESLPSQEFDPLEISERVLEMAGELKNRPATQEDINNLIRYQESLVEDESGIGEVIDGTLFNVLIKESNLSYEVKGGPEAYKILDHISSIRQSSELGDELAEKLYKQYAHVAETAFENFDEYIDGNVEKAEQIRAYLADAARRFEVDNKSLYAVPYAVVMADRLGMELPNRKQEATAQTAEQVKPVATAAFRSEQASEHTQEKQVDPEVEEKLARLAGEAQIAWSSATENARNSIELRHLQKYENQDEAVKEFREKLEKEGNDSSLIEQKLERIIELVAEMNASSQEVQSIESAVDAAKEELDNKKDEVDRLKSVRAQNHMFVGHAERAEVDSKIEQAESDVVRVAEYLTDLQDELQELTGKDESAVDDIDNVVDNSFFDKNSRVGKAFGLLKARVRKGAE